MADEGAVATISSLPKRAMAQDLAGARARARSSICFVSTGPPMLRLLTGEGPDAMGGAELQLSMIARYLRERDWDVSFLVGDFGQEREMLSADGIRILKAYPQDGSGTSAAGAFRDSWRLWRSLSEAGADVCVCRGLTGQAGVVAAWCRAYRRPYVFWFAKNADALYGVPQRSSLPMMERLPAAVGIRSADAVVLQTLEQGELLKRHFGRSGVLIRNAVPALNGASWNAADGSVLWVGSIQPKKRPGMVLEIAQSLPDVQFVMAGGPLRGHEDLHREIVEMVAGLPNVDYRGFVPFDETETLFRRASILLSTSEGLGEGFPNVFLQAWAAGAAVVSSCDPDQVISRHAIGSRFETAAEAREQIKRLLAGPEERRRLVVRAREYVEQQHSIERTGRRFEELLRCLAERRPVVVSE